jgi:hypothetical protein
MRGDFLIPKLCLGMLARQALLDDLENLKHIQQMTI